MFSVICKGNGFAPYLKATATAVGTRIPSSIPVDVHSHEPSVPPNVTHVDASNVKLINRPPKAVSGAVNAFSQVRYAHTDIQIPNFDAYRRDSNKDPKKPANQSVDDRRAFTYMMGTGVAVGAVISAKGIVRVLVESMAASKDVLALSKIEVDLNSVPEGKNLVIKWRGKPLFVRHRSKEEIERERSVDVSSLRDPEADDKRTKDPKFLVVIGVCTHLGCVPIANQGEYQGYYCPCHGSHYDSSGRIRKGPAPLNLEVPTYEITPENLLIVG